jgi:hypothetical protein
LIGNAGKGAYDEQAIAIENLLLGLNKKTSRGIPVGPVPSIVLSELIMASIDNKIRTYTNDFVRYTDDIRIYFNKREDAIYALHELTHYLYSYHRLVFSGEKTGVIPTKTFLKRYMRNEDKAEKEAVMAKAEKKTLEKLNELLKNIPPYSNGYDYEEQYEKIFEEIMDKEKFQILSDTYYELFKKSIGPPAVDYPFLRHLLRKAAKYRIRNLAPLVLEHFEIMLPLVREAVIYLNTVINEEFVANNKNKFESILSAYYMKIPLINLWLSHLLQNPNFNKINLPSDYGRIQSTRGKALIALRRGDTTWVRGFRDGIDALGPWEKRAVLYSSTILPFDEMKPWCEAVGASGDIIDKSISAYIISQKKSKK